jgi:hypothetical protein
VRNVIVSAVRCNYGMRILFFRLNKREISGRSANENYEIVKSSTDMVRPLFNSYSINSRM